MFNNEEQKEEATEEEKRVAVERGNVEEQKYKDIIPKEFYNIVDRLDSKIQQVIEINLRIDVPAAYAALRKDDKIPIESARLMVVAKFILYRSERRIIRFLDEEAKSRRHVEAANKSNAVKAERKESAENRKEADKAEKDALKKVQEQNDLIRASVKKGLATDIMVDIPANKHLRKEIEKKMLTRERCLCHALLIGTTAVVTDVEIAEEQESAEPIATPTRTP